jgi:hypothetical protein
MNEKAVPQRRWGTKVLNLIVLILPEIFSSKSKDSNQPKPVNSFVSTIPPLALNLCDGLAGMLIECIITEEKKLSRGSTIAKVREKCKATAKKSFKNHDKWCSATLIASAGQFSLTEKVLAYVFHTN